jgi:hypothetical protein
MVLSFLHQSRYTVMLMKDCIYIIHTILLLGRSGSCGTWISVAQKSGKCFLLEQGFLELELCFGF